MSEAHVEIARTAVEKLRALAEELDVAVAVADVKPDHEPTRTRISEILGKIHQVGENAMNDYRVNRKVARVERHWRAEFEKRENRP